MRVGCFGWRADRRGLATLSAILHRCLCPAKTLLVDMAQHRPFPTDRDAYPGADVRTLDEVMAERDWSWWLDGLDVVLTLETPYNASIYDAARKRGVRTILVAMPEYLDASLRPDVIALPTTWLADRHPDSPILPIPVEPFTPQPGSAVVHPGGSPARGDRNGTRIVLDASRHLPMAAWLVRAQSPPDRPWGKARVEVDDLADRERVYDFAAMVVLPRRYGGLSLPMQEAMGAGLPLLATDVEPYGDELHPAGRLAAKPGRALHAKGGVMSTWDVDPGDLAAAVRTVSADAGLRQEMAQHSATWAQGRSWEVLRPRWDAVLSGASALV